MPTKNRTKDHTSSSKTSSSNPRHINHFSTPSQDDATRLNHYLSKIKERLEEIKNIPYLKNIYSEYVRIIDFYESRSENFNLRSHSSDLVFFESRYETLLELTNPYIHDSQETTTNSQSSGSFVTPMINSVTFFTETLSPILSIATSFLNHFFFRQESRVYSSEEEIRETFINPIKTETFYQQPDLISGKDLNDFV